MDQKQQKMQKNAKTAAEARQAGTNANQYETADELGSQDQANAATFQQAKKQAEQRMANKSNRNS